MIRHLAEECEEAAFAALRPEQLGDIVKMPVPRDESQVVLHGQRRNPQIVVRHEGSCAFQLHEQAGILLGCFPIGIDYVRSLTSEKIREQRLVLGLTCPTVKPGFDLGKHNEGNPDFLTAAEQRGKRGVTLKEVGETVGIESDPHGATAYFHFS